MQRYPVYFIDSAGDSAGRLPPFKKRGYLEIMDCRRAPTTARIVLKTEVDNTFVCEERNIEAMSQVGAPRRNWNFEAVNFRKLPHLLLMMLCFLAGGLWLGGTEGGLIASLGVLLIPMTGFFPQFTTVVVALFPDNRANASDSEDEDEEAPPTLILSLPLEAYRQLWNDDLLKAS